MEMQMNLTVVDGSRCGRIGNTNRFSKRTSISGPIIYRESNIVGVEVNIFVEGEVSS
jgi:hypothetical protein